MSQVFPVILLILLFLVLLVGIPILMTRRAVSQVVRIFRRVEADSAENAKTIEELGLQPPTLAQRMLRFRDYKPRVLDSLVQAEVVRTTEDGRLYLSEQKLVDSGISAKLN